MKQTLIAAFPDERSAHAASSALKDLHDIGNVTLHASIVIVKEQDGTVKMRAGSEGRPVGMLGGMVCGGLIGGLGGPVGAMAGAGLGLLGGLFYDVFRSEFDGDFVDEVGALLEPGGSSVIADLDDTGATLLDARLAALGGRLLRRAREELVGEQLERQSAGQRGYDSPAWARERAA